MVIIMLNILKGLLKNCNVMGVIFLLIFLEMKGFYIKRFCVMCVII